MSAEPIILAIETALGEGSLALTKGETEIASVRGGKASRADDLIPLISAILDENSLNLSSVDLIAVSNGPGSYTGIRIGLSTAQALALGTKRPLLGVSVLESLAFTSGNKLVIAIVSLGRSHFVWQRFDEFPTGDEYKYEPELATAEQIYEFLQNSKAQNLTIVFESNAQKELAEYDPVIFHKVFENQRYKIASDNVAKPVAKYSYYLYKEGRTTRDLLPKYYLQNKFDE